MNDDCKYCPYSAFCLSLSEDDAAAHFMLGKSKWPDKNCPLTKTTQGALRRAVEMAEKNGGEITFQPPYELKKMNVKFKLGLEGDKDDE